MMWPFKKHPKRMTWPLPETDYEGNDIWALNFPKPQPMTPAEIALERISMNATPYDWAHSQAMNPYWAQQSPEIGGTPEYFCWAQQSPEPWNYMGLLGATPGYLRWIMGQGY